MANTTALRLVQMAKESTWGTAVNTAIAKMMVVTNFTVDPIIVNKPIRVIDGTTNPAQYNIQVARSGVATISGLCTPEYFPYILDSGFCAPIITGAGPFVYTFTAPTIATPMVINSRTLQFYDGNQCYLSNGSVVQSFDIMGAADDVWMYNSNWIAQNVLSGSVTASLANFTATPIPTASTVIKIDAIGGTVGTTTISATLIDFKLSVNNGNHLKPFLSGNLYPAAYGKGLFSASMVLTLEAGTNGVAELAAMLAGTGRLIELTGTNGTSTVKIQFAGDYTNVAPLWGDRNGNTTLQLTLVPRYDSATFASWLKIVCTSSTATLIANA